MNGQIKCAIFMQGILFGYKKDSKEYACNAGDPGSIPGWGRSPGEGNGYPCQYSCLENPLGQRIPVGYSPQHCKELDMTEAT